MSYEITGQHRGDRGGTIATSAETPRAALDIARQWAEQGPEHRHRDPERRVLRPRPARYDRQYKGGLDPPALRLRQLCTLWRIHARPTARSARMPRFYSDTTLGTDLEGVMLRDAHTARQEAARAVAEMARDRADKSPEQDITIQVRDEAGERVGTARLTLRIEAQATAARQHRPQPDRASRGSRAS
jgi:hypothetical protein